MGQRIGGWEFFMRTATLTRMTVNAAVNTIAIVNSLTPKNLEYQEPNLPDTDPMEGFASAQELEQYRRSNDGFYLGNIHPDHKTNFPCSIQSDQHITIEAGTRSGKDRSILIQNALRWSGGFIGLDPKGEIASHTAMRRGTKKEALGTGTSVRRFLGQKVAILDPFNQVVGASRAYKKQYNPLSDIDIKSSESQSEIIDIASACIVSEEGKNAHFSDNAETLMCGVIETILYTLPKEKQTLPTVREYLLKSFDELELLLQDIDPYQPAKKNVEPISKNRIPKNGLSAEALGVIEKLQDSNEIGSFHSTLSRNLKWLAEPKINNHLNHSDVSIKNIIQSGGSVYIVVPPNQVEKYRSWIRTIFQIAINAKVELGFNQKTKPTYFLLNEFPLLGRSKEIELGASTLAGYNIKFIFVIQHIGQLKNLYKENWETFASNSGAIIAFGLNDELTESYISNRIGKVLAWESSYSTNTGTSAQGLGTRGGVSDGVTTSTGRNERPIRRPNEVKEQSARETMRAFVIPSSGKAFIIERKNYDDIKEIGLFDNREHLINWERKYRGKIE